VPTGQYDVITVDLVLEIEPLDLDDDTEIHGYTDVRIVESLRQAHAARPDVTAAANAPMIRVNEQLGFVTTREVLVVSRSF